MFSAPYLAVAGFGLLGIGFGAGVWWKRRHRANLLGLVTEEAPVGLGVVDARGQVVAANRAFRAGAQGGPLPSGEIHDAQTGRWLRVIDKPVEAGTLQVVADVTDLKAAESRLGMVEVQLGLQGAVSAVLAQVSSTDDAVAQTLEAMCRQGEWDAGFYWAVEGDMLRCTHSWEGAAGAPKLEAYSRQYPVRPGAGLLAAVWQAGEPGWSAEMASDEHVARARRAEADGLCTAFCIPVRDGTGVRGVVELWSRERRESDAASMQAMRALGLQIGVQLGHYLEREQADERLRSSEERYRTITEIARDAIVTISDGGEILSVNSAAEQLFGYTVPEMVGRPLTMIMPEEMRKLHESGLKRYVETGIRQTRWDGLELPAQRRDGSAILVEVSIAEFDLGGRRTFTGYMRDITQRKEEEKILRYQALHDALTDLPNRTLLHDRLERAVLVGQRHGSPIALLFMDLDRFKEVNDTFGHHCGDLLLRQVADRLRATMRESDTVARLGGDEFALLLPLTDEAGAELAAQRVLDALRPPFQIESQSVEIGASIGITVCPDHGSDTATLMRRADVAMYAAKRWGGEYTSYSPERDEVYTSRLLLTGELRRAIEDGDLRLQYQPKVSLHGAGRQQVEALVRWHHPERGMVPPDTFISVAEETGLIKQLTHWVLKEAVRQHTEWLAQGLDIGIAVNFSVRTLHDSAVVGQVIDLLETHGLPPSALQIEITESALMQDPESALETLTRLRHAGIRTSIDDFGTGYSSLGYLKRLPVDEIKIDKSFVLDLATNHDDVAIVSSVIALGHNLGLEVVAEGVENQRVVDILTSMGCDTIQGYFISRPVDAADLAAWLTNRRLRQAS